MAGGIQIRVAHDSISPYLAKKLRAMENRSKHLRAMGTALESLTKQAFTDASVRPSPWAPRKSARSSGKTKVEGRNGKMRTAKWDAAGAGGEATLRMTGMLWHSIRITAMDDSSVTVGSDRHYAPVHQLGSKKRGIPARPFFPFSESGLPTMRAKQAVEMALRASMKDTLKK